MAAIVACLAMAIVISSAQRHQRKRISKYHQRRGSWRNISSGEKRQRKGGSIESGGSNVNGNK